MNTYDLESDKKFDRVEYCKRWRSEINPDWHKDHYTKTKDVVLARQRANHKQDPRKRMLATIKCTAKKLGIPFDIGVDDIIIPETCPVLGIPIILGDCKRSDNSPSLDKFIPELGYVKGNVAVISWRANRLKNNGTLEEFQFLVEWMANQLSERDQRQPL